MGRLTLNILLSFAQFERKVTGKRIRDKFEAIRRKGLWIFGKPPYGYTKDKHNVLIEEKPYSNNVVLIFKKFIELKSGKKLREFLKEQNIQSKAGKIFDVGYL